MLHFILVCVSSTSVNKMQTQDQKVTFSNLYKKNKQKKHVSVFGGGGGEEQRDRASRYQEKRHTNWGKAITRNVREHEADIKILSNRRK